MPIKKIQKSKNNHNSNMKQKTLSEYFSKKKITISRQWIYENSADAAASASLNAYIDSESVLCDEEPNIVNKIQSVTNDKNVYPSDQLCLSEDYVVDSLSNLGTMGGENINRLNENSRKSELTETGNIEQMQMEDEQIVCDVDSNNVNEIQSVSKDERLYPSDQQCVSEDYEIDSSTNSGTAGSEILDRSNDTSPKSEVTETTDNIERTKTEDEQMVCFVDPNTVNEIQYESAQSQEKGIKKRGVKKVSKLWTNYSEFIRHTINEYDQHLKTPNTFKGILTDESLDLLSTLTLESEDNIKLVSYLFCVDHREPEGIADVAFPKASLKINYDCSSLYERGLITFSPLDADVLTVEQCLELLTLLQIQEACEFFLNITDWKSKTKEEIRRKIINVFSTEDEEKNSYGSHANINKKLEFLNKLRSKVKKWKLSDLARESITELTILMHLDNIFEMGCSIDFSRVYNDRPGLKFKPSEKPKRYPVDKKMILDNATIIFQDRKEFCTYLNAFALSKEYRSVQDKHEFVLRIYEVKKEISHCIALPAWLRRFTPINFYVEILADGVKYLKKAEDYKNALEILDLLIEQVACMQNSKAKWYATKAFIQHKHLELPEEAASTLCEAFNAGLPEETVMTLQRRARWILNFTPRNQIDQKLINILQDNAENEILERSIQTEPDYLRFQIERKNSNSKTRPRYNWNNEPVLVEILCCNLYKNDHREIIAEHWEGNIMNAIYFIMFSDIIYTKPLAIGGIFLSHYQQYPLDMRCENFYINRKARIDDFLIKIENSSKDDIKKIITDRYDKLKKCNLPEMTHKTVNIDNIKIVVDCLGGRRLAAICRRLAKNYNYMRLGFPDLTLCNTGNNTIQFREVKTNDTAKENQLQWLHYLNKHDIEAGFCYLNNKKKKDSRQETANKSHTGNSHSTKTNVEDVQPGPSSALN